MKLHKLSGLLVTAVAVLAVACASQMEPAQKALDGLNNAVTAADAAGASKYIPDQLAAVQGKLTELKAAFGKKDYAAVLKGAPAVLTEAEALVGAAAAKKDEAIKAATAAWPALAGALPDLVGAVKSRVDVLGKSRRLPEGVDLEAAKTGLADATSLWDKAQQLANSGGSMEEAAAAAQDAKAKAEAAAAALKLKLPAG
ncbi:MAG: hypothetical protein IT480_13830 [Gammaproteobacteria bacterium]|nr:hypothetical protein [Gammaproteobacteria bacterium]